jgi:hypothetical protein
MVSLSFLYIYGYLRLDSGKNAISIIQLRKHHCDHAEHTALQTFKTILLKKKTTIGLNYYHQNDHNQSITTIMCHCWLIGSFWRHIIKLSTDAMKHQENTTRKKLKQETWLFVKAFHNIIVHRLKNRESRSRLLQIVQPKEKHRNSNRHRYRTNTESRKQRRAVVSITAKAKHKHYWVT